MSAFFLAVALGLFVSLALFLASRYVRLATFWGILWGPAMGFWFMAPLVLQGHYLHPEGLRQWLIVDSFFAMVFAVVGFLLSALVSWPLAAYGLVSSSGFRLPLFATGVWSAACLPVAYLAVGELIEWGFFSRLAGLGSWPVVAGVSGVFFALFAAVVVAYRWCAVVWPALPERRIVHGIVACAVLGVAALWFRIGHVPLAPAARAPSLVHRSSDRRPAPLLVIGLDGGNWRTLRPLIGRGMAPTFARIASQGIQGEVRALWPPYWSTPAWGAILTGHTEEDIGVHEDLGATVAGLPPFELPLTLNPLLNPMLLVELGLIHAGVIHAAPISRDQIHWPPVWERLSRAGLKTAVVHFPFTYPAIGQADYVVSDRVVTDLLGMMPVEPGRRDQLVSPRDEADRLLSWFSGERGADPAVLKELLPRPDWPKPRDALVNPSEVVGKVLDTGQRMFSVTEQLVREDPNLAVVMLYMTDFDTICHAFWPYRFPEDYPRDPPSEADVLALGPVVDTYLEYIDRRLGQLIAAFPTPPNVIIVADHGEEATHKATLWRAWHSEFGVFLAAGPDLEHRSGQLSVSYFDVVPTMLDVLNFDKPADLRGHSVIGAR